MPWGPPICRLRASGRRISGSAFGGWPTPIDGLGKVRSLEGALKIAATKGVCHDLNTMVQMAGWPPMERDWRSEAGPGHDARMAETRGKPLSRQTATTGGRGALAPEFSRWLMGYPAGWESYADSATPSSPKYAATFIRAFMDATDPPTTQPVTHRSPPALRSAHP